MKEIYLVHIYKSWYQGKIMNTVDAIFRAYASKELAIKFVKNFVDNCISNIKRANDGELPEGVSVNTYIDAKALLHDPITYLIYENDHNLQYSIEVEEIELIEDEEG